MTGVDPPPLEEIQHPISEVAGLVLASNRQQPWGLAQIWAQRSTSMLHISSLSRRARKRGWEQRLSNLWCTTNRVPSLQYNDSAMSFIECSLSRINHRIWLLKNILWWWVLPVSAGGILIVAQIIMLVGWQESTLYWKLGTGVGVGSLTLAVVYWGNLWTARKYWQPRKAELEAIADSLKGG